MIAAFALLASLLVSLGTASLAAASTITIQGGSIDTRLAVRSDQGGGCTFDIFADVPIVKGVTTYTAHVSDTVLGPSAYSTSPPYASDHIVFGPGVGFHAPAGEHQIPLAGGGGGVGVRGVDCSGVTGEPGRFGLIRVVGEIPADKRGLTGSVRDDNGQGLAHAAVAIHGNTGGAAAFTGPTGYYNAVLDAGRYSVSVPRGNGRPTRCSPGSASATKCALNLTHANGEADFAVCPSATGASAQATAGIAAANGAFLGATAAAAPCPLDVTLTGLENRVPSGLHFDPSVQDPEFLSSTPDRLPVPLGEGQPQPFPQECVSGCVNALISVKSNGNPVVDASVTADVGSLVGPFDPVWPYPVGFGYEGRLCTVQDTAEPTCGSSVTATTNTFGQVYVRYWPPGVVAPGGALVRVTAHKCSNVCGAGQFVGHDRRVFRIKPTVIWKASAPLREPERQWLVQWDERRTPVTDVAPFETAFQHFFPALAPVGAVLKLQDLADLQSVAFFLSRFKMQAAGLLEVTPANYAQGLIGNNFEGQLLDTFRNYARYLRVTTDLGHGGVAQQMRLLVYEVSYCEGGGQCDQPDVAGKDFLVFRLEGAKDAAELRLGLHSSFSGGSKTAAAYVARDWMRAQF